MFFFGNWVDKWESKLIYFELVRRDNGININIIFWLLLIYYLQEVEGHKLLVWVYELSHGFDTIEKK